MTVRGHDHDQGSTDHDGSLLSRRLFAQGAIASAGLLVAGPALAGQERLPRLGSTAESPLGPFYPLNPLAENDADLTRLAGHADRARGEVIELTGRVLDLRGNPIAGARLELWQANAAGRYRHESDPATEPLDPDFQGFAALSTGADGAYRIVTIKPGGYDSPIGHRPPHLHFDLRGRTHRSVAQMYFPEDAEEHARDTLYRALGAEAGTSVAARDPADPSKYRWDVVLMG
ncbi:protocatechuate 3,4-dioxygenase [Sphingosinicella terrae]|uniref:dioxygenase family protein n=1 Tax=Sphingosinicella terrae TaxID=2172047 RepID=UPI000E0CFF74|nr:protocatechuate 3,4-dioxygenase [Sphingosinicella terrae]